MLEVLGFVFLLLAAMGVTVLPFLMWRISGLGGGLKKFDYLICLGIFLMAIYLWTMILKVVNISIN
jgi:hypothetical protein